MWYARRTPWLSGVAGTLETAVWYAPLTLPPGVAGTPETAVWYALQSAAITHAVYRACRRGELRGCSCGARRAHSLEHWKWACQRGLKYSVKKARKFVNSREVERDARSKMNMHNNNLGIRVSRGV